MTTYTRAVNAFRDRVKFPPHQIRMFNVVPWMDSHIRDLQRSWKDRDDIR